MGSPGVVDREKGTVIGAYNLNWKTLQPVKEKLENNGTVAEEVKTRFKLNSYRAIKRNGLKSLLERRWSWSHLYRSLFKLSLRIKEGVQACIKRNVVHNLRVSDMICRMLFENQINFL